MQEQGSRVQEGGHMLVAPIFRNVFATSIALL